MASVSPGMVAALSEYLRENPPNGQKPTAPPSARPALGSQEHIEQIFSKINKKTPLEKEDESALKDYLMKNGNSPEQAEAFVKNPVSFWGGEIKGG